MGAAARGRRRVAAVDDGELHVELHGEKLRGRFVLIRTGRDAAAKEQWLLLHKHDESPVEGWDPEDHPRSVLSGRTNDEVQADPARVDARRRGHHAVGAAAHAAPTADELAALDALGTKGHVDVRRAASSR